MLPTDWSVCQVPEWTRSKDSSTLADVASIEVIRPYVEKKVAECLGVDSVKVDADGDIPIRQGSAVSIVRLVDGPGGAMVRVFSPILAEVTKTPELLEHLNQMNTDASYVRFFWAAEQVLCAVDILGEDLQVSELANALRAIALSADNMDDSMMETFGGHQFFVDGPGAEPAVTDPAAGSPAAAAASTESAQNKDAKPDVAESSADAGGYL